MSVPAPDWENPARLRRLKHARKDLLCRATGADSTHGLLVLDACAGLGHDTLTLLFAGARVRACERHPAVFAALQAEYRRLCDGAFWGPVLGRLELIHADAVEVMQTEPHDVIYLDPMYPETRRKAAATAAMQSLAELVGGDEDADRLLAPARRSVRRRVVVKRPRRAAPLGGQAAHETVAGKALRFDLYRPEAAR